MQYNQSVNSLDPDQDRSFVGPDLGPKCLQKLSADDTCKQRIKDKHTLENETCSGFPIFGAYPAILYIFLRDFKDIDSESIKAVPLPDGSSR